MNINSLSLTDLLLHTDNIQNKNVENNNKIIQPNNADFNQFEDEKNITKAFMLPGNLNEKENSMRENEISANEKMKECFNKINNQITADNYEKYEELGIIPDKDEPQKYVTVSERIQIMLAANCENYQPTGNISIDDLKSVYGDNARAYEIAVALNDKGLKVTQDKVKEIDDSCKMAENLDKITTSMAKYLVTNHMELTIGNIYTAKYSTNQESIETNFNSVGNEFSDEFNEIKPQIEKLISGYEFNENDAINGAYWLYTNDLSITAPNIKKICDIIAINQYNCGNGLKNITQEDWIDKLTSYTAYGEESKNLNPSQSQDIVELAKMAEKTVQNSTHEQIKKIVLTDKEINLFNIQRLQEKIVHNHEYNSEINASKEEKTQSNLTIEQNEKYTTAMRQLEEIRLLMTTQGFATMIKNGIEISLEPLTNIVDELKRQENEYVNSVFQIATKQDSYTVTQLEQSMFTESNQYMQNFKNAPAYVLGSVLNQDISFEIQEMTWEGEIKKGVLESAQMAYDTLSTKPRKDLGDSLKKAFAGIDSILQENGLESTQENERTVRILAYNEMEINRTNIEQIQAMDLEVNRLIDNLTPKTTAYLITNGINPLRTDICKLNDKLDEINKEIGKDDVERYSEFLYKLEKNKQISKEDKNAYIGIYKALNLIEKSDRRAVGALIKQGSEITINHLLTATKSAKKTGMDIELTKETGVLEKRAISDSNTMQRLEYFNKFDEPDMVNEQKQETKNISVQRFYESIIKKVTHDCSPQILLNMEKRTSLDHVFQMPINQFYQYMNEARTENEEELKNEQQQYYQKQVEEIDKIQFTSEEALAQMFDDGLAPSVENLLASYMIDSEKGKVYQKLIQSFGKNEKEVEKKLSAIYDHMDDEDEVEEAILDVASELSSDYEDENSTNEKFLEKDAIDELRMANRTLHYICNAAKQKSYYVPMNIAGEQTTMRFMVRSSNEEKGHVEIFLNTNKTGQIQSNFKVTQDKIEGYVVSNDNNTTNLLQTQIANLEKSFEELGFSTQRIDVITGKYKKNQNSTISKVAREDTSNTKILYQSAKTFIGFIKELYENS